MKIVQMSDIHVGAKFRPDLMETAIEEANASEPDLTCRLER